MSDTAAQEPPIEGESNTDGLYRVLLAEANAVVSEPSTPPTQRHGSPEWDWPPQGDQPPY